jgi:hypothetical protein
VVAVHLHVGFRRALRLAEKVFTLSTGDPTVVDTRGWVDHLLGNEAAATELAKAVELDPELDTRDEVKQLRLKLRRLAAPP